ncbi:MAG TPA: hypothetical protein VJ995_10340 [Geothermobacteraceae bacterium]|nr:hypothetical protein [Geothermobacteraceae bacterium]
MDKVNLDQNLSKGCRDNPDNRPQRQGGIDPWLCHVCGDGYRNQSATACALCFQLACRAHIDLIVVDNPIYHHSELKPVCSRCQQQLAETLNESS